MWAGNPHRMHHLGEPMLSPRPPSAKMCHHLADQLRQLGWTGGFASPHWLCYVVTSECRALCSITSGLAWGLGPRPAVSSNRVINTKHINQLSRFHAQKLSVLNFVRFDQALYFLAKSCLWRSSLSKLCLWHTNSNTPFIWGLPLWSLSSWIWLYWYGFVPCSCITPQYAPCWLKWFASWVALLLCLPLRSRLFG